jgi:hypothetical protein
VVTDQPQRAYRTDEAGQFNDLRAFCIFVGYPRSGHSLLGSLLDAHPSIIIGHELDVLKYVEAGFKREQIYHLLVENSKSYAGVGRQWSGYSYEVLGQWQGEFKTLRIIGDKKGGATTERLRSNPGALKRLHDTVRIPVKYVHVVRNPYDNITTISKKHGLNLSNSVAYYFALCETVANFKKETPASDIFDVRHEEIIRDPKSVLTSCCEFLSEGAAENYLQACAAIVHQSPHKTRSEVEWTAQSVALVEKGIRMFPFLHGYSYEN